MIDDRREAAPLFAVVLAADFGAVHCAVQGPGGEPIQLPEGVAHLAEHVLFFNHLDGPIKTLRQDFAGEFNARVDRTRSLFWVVGSAELAPSSTQVVAAVAILLNVVFDDIDPASLGALLSKCQRDVDNEILYRTGPDFKLSESLWHSLFPDHPLGRSGIGTYESIASITLTHLGAALKTLQGSLSSITLLTRGMALGELSSICEQVIPHGDQQKRWNGMTDLTTPPEAVSRQFLEFPEDGGRVATAYTLPPLAAAYSDRGLLRQMVLAAYLFREFWNQKIEYVSDEVTRVFMVHTGWICPWLVDRDTRPFLLRSVRMEIERWARAVRGRQLRAIAARLTEDRLAMLRLCQVGLAHGITAEEMIDAFDEFSAETLLELSDELQQPLRSAQSYLGPRLFSAERG